MNRRDLDTIPIQRLSAFQPLTNAAESAAALTHGGAKSRCERSIPTYPTLFQSSSYTRHLPESYNILPLGFAIFGASVILAQQKQPLTTAHVSLLRPLTNPTPRRPVSLCFMHMFPTTGTTYEAQPKPGLALLRPHWRGACFNDWDRPFCFSRMSFFQRSRNPQELQTRSLHYIALILQVSVACIRNLFRSISISRALLWSFRCELRRSVYQEGT